MARHGHDARLIPPIYVQPFVKRLKNAMVDAEAIAEAALRPTKRAVLVKTAEQQSRAMLFRTRELLVAQRTQLVNALRGHLVEYGVIVAKGMGNVEGLAAVIRDEASALPDLARDLSTVYLGNIEQVSGQITALERRISASTLDSGVVRRLQKMPGIGPICTMAVETFASAMQTFQGRATLPPSWVWCRANIPLASKGLGGPRRWASAISTGH